MLNGQKIVVVMPAYNAEKTLEWTYREIPQDIVDKVLLVDDGSVDKTVAVSKRLGIEHLVHQKNQGYGANQKTCYTLALKARADIVIMVHPDYQYTPRLITAIAAMIASGHFDVVLGSRILGTGTRKGGMPLYKYISNRFLTFFQNILLGYKLSEYHTGFRGFSRNVLATLPLLENSDDFLFDNQMLVQAIRFGYRVGEISCPTRYITESSSISFSRSVVYGLGVLRTSFQCRLSLWGLKNYPFLSPIGKKLPCNSQLYPNVTATGPNP